MDGGLCVWGLPYIRLREGRPRGSRVSQMGCVMDTGLILRPSPNRLTRLHPLSRVSCARTSCCAVGRVGKFGAPPAHTVAKVTSIWMRVSKSTPINIPTTDRAAIAIAISIAIVTPAGETPLWNRPKTLPLTTEPYAGIE